MYFGKQNRGGRKKTYVERAKQEGVVKRGGGFFGGTEVKINPVKMERRKKEKEKKKKRKRGEEKGGTEPANWNGQAKNGIKGLDKRQHVLDGVNRKGNE